MWVLKESVNRKIFQCGTGLSGVDSEDNCTMAAIIQDLFRKTISLYIGVAKYLKYGMTK